MAHSTPLVTETLLHLADGAEPILVESSAWWHWVRTADCFRFTSTAGTFTAHHEGVGTLTDYWYAYRRQGGRLHKRYLGKAHALTVTRLQSVAAVLADPQPALPLRSKATTPTVAPAAEAYSAVWYWEHADPQTAVGMALAARDWEHIVPWLSDYSETLFKAGNVLLLRQWYAAIPDAVLWRSPRLAFYATGLLLMTHQLPQAEVHFAQLVRLLEGQTEHALDPEIVTMRAVHAALRGDDAAALHLAQQAEQHVPADAAFLRSTLAVGLLALYWRHGDFARVREAAELAQQVGAAAGHLQAVIAGRCTQGLLALMEGQPERALGHFDEALALAAVETEHPVVGLAYIGKAQVWSEWQALEPAQRAWEQGMVLLRSLGDTTLLRQAGEVGLRLALARGNEESAAHLVDELQQWCPFPDQALHAVCVAEWSLAQGWLAPARDWLHQVTLVAATENYPLWMTQVRVAARILLATQEYAACYELCQTALTQVAEHHQAWHAEVRWLLVQASAGLGATPEADAILHHLLPLVLAMRSRRFFTEAGPFGAAIMQSYLTRHGAALSTSEQHRLRDLYHIPTTKGATTLPRWLRLTQRELALLPLLDQGCANADIARRWGISVGTVKTHLHHLYAKLLVCNRMGALRQARLLGLLPA